MIFRITLALDNDHVSGELAKLLRKDQDFILSHIRRGQNIVHLLANHETDMLIISKKRAGDNPEEMIDRLKRLIDPPSIIMIGENEPRHRAELLSLGVDAILEGDIPLNNIADAISGQISLIQEMKKETYSTQDERDRRLGSFIVNSPSMTMFMQLVEKIVRRDSSLLILGETGSGKEYLARAIHNESHRSEYPFVPVHCAAMPESLIESELFGHERGAFTGATRSHRGAFEIAHRGTIFLDEIGDIPLHLQTKLLRVLQDQTFTRLGGEKNIKVDVRIMAATNKDLDITMNENQFRRDLFYRLSVMTLKIPPLRERKEDIAELAHTIIKELTHKTGTGVSEITTEALNKLIEYEWPGNIRELRNVIERAMLLSDGDTITASEFPEEISGLSSISDSEFPGDSFSIAPPSDWSGRTWNSVREEVLLKAEKIYLEQVLTAARGRINDAAKLSGMTSRALYNKMRDHGLDKNDFKI